jgi:aldose 1-epimerase
MSPGYDAPPVQPQAGVVVLSSGDARLEASPADGGTLIGWSVADIHLLRRRPPGEVDPLRSACFPLAPFSNVVRNGGFHFQDRFHPLARNHPLESDPIHGDSWLAAWSVDELAGHHLLMSYAHAATNGFPFRYHVSQELTLARRSLSITLRLTNTDDRAMPAGLGLHPYFRRVPGARLQAAHAGRWEDTRVVDDSRFCMPREIGKETLDACYAGWSGLACLRWPRDEVILTLQAAAPASALVVFSPSLSDFVCVEPVTHMNDGFNALAAGVLGTGVRTLLPGEEMSLRATISVQVSASPPQSTRSKARPCGSPGFSRRR